MTTAIVIGAIVIAVCSVAVLIIMRSEMNRMHELDKRDLEIKAKAKGKK
jgi:multisubunit Na+/H+ antiporter MnhC subunit